MKRMVWLKRNRRCGLRDAVLLCAALALGLGPAVVACGDESAEYRGVPAAPLTTDDTGESLVVLEADEPVLQFNYAMRLAEGANPDRTRCGYIHPLYDLRGNVMTMDFPKDHYHHRGVSFMFPGVTRGERKADHWHMRGVRTYFEEWLDRKSTPLAATIGYRSAWHLEDTPLEKGEKVAQEETWIHVYRKTEFGRAIDVHYQLTPVGEAITLKGKEDRDKGYGGFCIRTVQPAPAGVDPKSRLTLTTESEGTIAADQDRVPSRWADLSADWAGDGQRSGVAIIPHPENPGYPNGWTLRYYGFFGVAWPGMETYTIPAGETVHLKFRLWIHDGDVESGRVQEAYEEYANLSNMKLH